MGVVFMYVWYVVFGMKLIELTIVTREATSSRMNCQLACVWNDGLVELLQGFTKFVEGRVVNLPLATNVSVRINTTLFAAVIVRTIATAASYDVHRDTIQVFGRKFIQLTSYKGSYIIANELPAGMHLEWYQDLNIGPIAGISFSGVGFTRAERDEEEGKNSGEFKDNPFIVTSSSAAVAIVNGDSSQVEVVCKEWTSLDEDRCVTLFRATLETKGESWAYVGRQRAHYKRVCQIMFGVKPDSKFPRLISLGEDRVLVEYDLEKSTENDLHLQSSERLEQTAVPTCMAWYPSLTSEDFILTANNQFKMKLYNTTTKMCRKTVLGPSYGTPLQCLRIIHRQGNSRQKKKFYAAHRTADKVGLLKLPLDGNPHNSLAVIGHPGDVVDICCSHDGKSMFTGGATDATVFMWEMNFDVLEAASHLGGLGIVPFYDLLEGGQSGTLFREMENFFYYAQIRSQGLRTMDVHRVASTMKVEQIPYVMRALGYYPTQREIDDMMNEVKYSDYVKRESTKRHQPRRFHSDCSSTTAPAAAPPADILDAFCTLVQHGAGARNLLEQLQTREEHMSELELLDALAALTGQSYTDEIASDDEDAAAAAAAATSSSSSQWIETASLRLSRLRCH
ncbi:PREDICTED: WD repeat-containing protein 66-like [Priapulus caudatus]|uniref:WD repeat-containing protein 66-like n=1 Tax=Priapulus caudatus TaxID=37621 RepID=A0ABM1E8Y0_PRICU|nr:PREDICTED: WD repeat-containing protein 66-like [Priapulus caudatus]